MRLFDVLGPVMIGPSSSHTAGAAKIGYTAQKLLGEVPAQADIGLYGSFATTGKGHGTDRALVAGLLGLRPDDPRLPDSFALAAQRGMQFSIHPVELRSAHPNTAVLTLTSRTGRQLSLKAASVGGGRIRVTEIDGVPADFGGDSNTLIIHNEDTPGCIAEVTMALALRRINIASMQVFRAAAGGYAVMVLECDSHIPHALERQRPEDHAGRSGAAQRFGGEPPDRGAQPRRHAAFVAGDAGHQSGIRPHAAQPQRPFRRRCRQGGAGVAAGTPAGR
jgi:L-serine dehydratase